MYVDPTLERFGIRLMNHFFPESCRSVTVKEFHDFIKKYIEEDTYEKGASDYVKY